MSVISDIKMILESNSIHLLYDARLCTEQKERWDAIKNADLVEVVRCKDCVHHKPFLGSYQCSVFDWINTEDDYCSFAEREKK